MSDIVMSELDSIALALTVSQDWSSTPIILITDCAAECQQTNSLEALVYSVVPEPF